MKKLSFISTLSDANSAKSIYVQVNEIKVETSQGSIPKALTFGPGVSGASSAANTIVHVSITYNVLNPFGTFNWYRTDGGSSLIRITSNGYDVIS